jgi:hypothetical protein
MTTAELYQKAVEIQAGNAAAVGAALDAAVNVAQRANPLAPLHEVSRTGGAAPTANEDVLSRHRKKKPSGGTTWSWKWKGGGHGNSHGHSDDDDREKENEVEYNVKEIIQQVVAAVIVLRIDVDGDGGDDFQALYSPARCLGPCHGSSIHSRHFQPQMWLLLFFFATTAATMFTSKTQIHKRLYVPGRRLSDAR